MIEILFICWIMIIYIYYIFYMCTRCMDDVCGGKKQEEDIL